MEAAIGSQSVARRVRWGGECLNIAACIWMLLPPAMAVGSGAPPAGGVARLPAMGWSSWNAFHGGINEAVITNVTDQLISTGLRDAGYVYVNLDDWCVFAPLLAPS